MHPLAITFWQVLARRPGSEYPEDAIHNLSVVMTQAYPFWVGGVEVAVLTTPTVRYLSVEGFLKTPCRSSPIFEIQGGKKTRPRLLNS